MQGIFFFFLLNLLVSALCLNWSCEVTFSHSRLNKVLYCFYKCPELCQEAGSERGWQETGPVSVPWHGSEPEDAGQCLPATAVPPIAVQVMSWDGKSASLAAPLLCQLPPSVYFPRSAPHTVITKSTGKKILKRRLRKNRA